MSILDNRKEAAKAQAAFANYMGPVMSKILNNSKANGIQYGSNKLIGLGGPSSFPLDLLYGEEEEVNYKNIVSDWRKTL
tara:strand:- start:223 stop:459 length:237 start_codon:yes stop_codon:yes gene_type:complete